MQRIEKLAENFVEAAEELLKASGGYNINFFQEGPAIAMTESTFDNFANGLDITTIVRESASYPIEKSVTVGGVKFFCITKDWDTWAKLKGYVKGEAV